MVSLVIIVLVALLVLSILTIAITIVSFESGEGQGGRCENQTDCKAGYVCGSTDTKGTTTCKSGLGYECQSKADCSTGLTCSSNNACEVEDAPTTSFRQNVVTTGFFDLEREADSERNSEGSAYDEYFDVRSTKTTSSESLDESSSELYEIERREGKIVAACSYSRFSIFLLEGGMECEIKEDLDDPTCSHITYNNVPLSDIFAFRGILHALGSDRTIYRLPNVFLESSSWKWERVRCSYNDIIHVSCTYDSSYLWVQTPTEGMLLDSSWEVKDRVPFFDKSKKRMYGKDVGSYIEVDDNSHVATVYPSMKKIRGVRTGILSGENSPVIIYTNDSPKYSRVVMLNWLPYYLKG